MASTKRTIRKSTVLAFLYCFEKEPRMFLILARAIHYSSFHEEQWWRHEGRLYSQASVFAGQKMKGKAFEKEKEVLNYSG